MKNSIGETIDPNHSVVVRDCETRRRVVVNGEVIAESDATLTLTENGHETYYFPPDAVKLERLTATGDIRHCPYKGDWRHMRVTVGDAAIDNGAWSYHSVLAECPRIQGYVAFYPNKVDPSSVF